VATAVDVAGPVASDASPVSSTTPAPAPAAPDAAATATDGPSASVVHSADAPGVKPPVLQKSPLVVYPQLARAARVQGAVMVSALVDEKGRVSEARAVSVGNEILRQAAVAHVLQRQYLPGQKDGVPVKVRIIVYVTYKFQN
jgi:TonB family protein